MFKEEGRSGRRESNSMRERPPSFLDGHLNDQQQIWRAMSSDRNKVPLLAARLGKSFTDTRAGPSLWRTDKGSFQKRIADTFTHGPHSATPAITACGP